MRSYAIVDPRIDPETGILNPAGLGRNAHVE